MKRTLLTFILALVALTALAQPPKTIVARIWHGTVPKAKADAYEKYLLEGVKQILAIKGNLGAQAMRRDNGANVEFQVISYWPNRDTIRAYAGKDIDKTHHLPKDKEFLVKVEPTVVHYDVFFEKKH